ncbi:RHS repeat-associated core domain-containing protein, partial [Nocardia cyriacigeorgica]
IVTAHLPGMPPHPAAGTWNPEPGTAADTGAMGADPATTAHAPHLLRRDDYTWRPDGYLTSHTTTHPGTGPDHRQYTLDPIGRVTAITRNGALAEHYTYDKLSNITSGGVVTPDATTPGPAHPTSPGQPGSHPAYPSPPGLPPNPAAPQQHSPANTRREYHNNLLIRDGRHQYHYDPAGRLIRKTTTRISRKPDVWHYRYNALDQLTDVYTPDGQWWHYTYDALGRRTTKQRLTDHRVVLERIDFSWDEARLIEQSTKQGVIRWCYRPGAYTAITQCVDKNADAKDFAAVASDPVGAPTSLIDPTTSRVVTNIGRDLWGRTSSSAGFASHLRYPGQYYDPESGLHYNLLRTYDPSTGRYLTKDPLGLGPSDNPNIYPHNPTAWIDPLGLTPDCGDHVAIYKAPTKGMTDTLLDHGFRESDFPGSGFGFPDGRAYFGLGDEGLELARDYARRGGYDDNVLRVLIPREDFDQHFRQYVYSYDGKAVNEVAIPNTMFDILNRYGRDLV